MAAHRGLPPWKLSIHKNIGPSFTPNFAPSAGTITTLQVKLASEAAEPENLAIGMTENYTITVEAPSTAILSAPSVWGLIRGLETFSQLLDWDGSAWFINRAPLSIVDYPRFPWRGVMIDTARHYMDLATLRRLVNIMSAFKFNVFHWHMVDAQSFPFASAKYPDLKKGAFAETAIYTPAELTEMVAYARARGVIIMPEFDAPGHAASWGIGYPGVTVDCWDYIGQDKMYYAENIIPLNPANPLAHEMVKGLFDELAGIFPSEYLHIGGDEVNTGCWRHSKEVAAIDAYKKEHNYTTDYEIQAAMVLETQRFLTEEKHRKAVVWEETLDLPGTPVLNDTVVHVWRNDAAIASALQKGYKVVLSEGFYQDMQAPLCTLLEAGQPECTQDKRYWLWIWTWLDMYQNDPVRGTTLTPEQASRIMGGEAASWDESADASNIEDRAFARSPAVAERLWSPVQYYADRNMKPERAHAENRMLRTRCYLARRGISRAGPLAPDYCQMSTSTPTPTPTASASPAPAATGGLVAAIGVVSTLCVIFGISSLVLGLLMMRQRRQIRLAYKTMGGVEGSR